MPNCRAFGFAAISREYLYVKQPACVGKARPPSVIIFSGGIPGGGVLVGSSIGNVPDNSAGAGLASQRSIYLSSFCGR